MAWLRRLVAKEKNDRDDFRLERVRQTHDANTAAAAALRKKFSNYTKSPDALAAFVRDVREAGKREDGA